MKREIKNTICSRSALSAGVFFTLALFAPLSAFAGTETIATTDTLLQQMQQAEGADYIQARSALIALGSEADERLQTIVKEARWDSASWQLEAMAAIALSWRSFPEDCERVYSLSGISPRDYLRRRLPKPEVARELRRLTRVAPVFVEVLLKTSVDYIFSPASDYPSHLTAEQRAELRENEKAALRLGLISALGRSKHSVAAPVILNILADSSSEERDLRVASVALGEASSGARIPTLFALEAVVSNPNYSLDLRSNAIQGIAKHRSPAALALLEGYLKTSTDLSVRKASTVGVAIIGSAWRALYPSADSATLRTQAAQILVATLTHTQTAAFGQTMIEALSVVRASESVALLQTLLKKPGLSVDAQALVQRALVRVERAVARGR